MKKVFTRATKNSGVTHMWINKITSPQTYPLSNILAHF